MDLTLFPLLTQVDTIEGLEVNAASSSVGLIIIVQLLNRPWDRDNEAIIRSGSLEAPPLIFISAQIIAASE